MTTEDSQKAHPFLKWAGGKGQLLQAIVPFRPIIYHRYFEPFLGGGALFFSSKPSNAILNDTNSELISCYRAVRDEVDNVIIGLSKHRYEKEHYYSIRALNPINLTTAAAAARTIYLNRSGFNGLYRVNRSGAFNVPFGTYTNPTICDEPNLRACSQALETAELQSLDFDEAVSSAVAGDFVYLDPPYVPVSATANFVRYGAQIFGPEDHRRLAKTFASVSARGVHALLSNSDTPEVRRLYAKYRMIELRARRSVNSAATRRGPVGELLVLSEIYGA